MDVLVEHVLLSLFLIHIASSRVHRFVIVCKVRMRFDKDTSRLVFVVPVSSRAEVHRGDRQAF